MTAATDEFPAARSSLSQGLRHLAGALRPDWKAWLAFLLLALLAIAATVPDPLAPLIALRPAETSGLVWLNRYLLSDPATIEFWTQMLHAAHASLAIAIGAAAAALAIGAAIGLLAASRAGSLPGGLLMRLLAVLRVFPALILAIVALAALGIDDLVVGPASVPYAVKLTLVIGLLLAPRVAHVAHCAMCEERRAPHVVAECAFGASGGRLALRNSIGATVACAALLVGPALILETSLSFLGLGVQPATSSWGGMLAASVKPMMAGQWRPIVLPGVLILATVCAFNVIAEALRARLDLAHVNARSGA
jgi:ABC-type dipeptide/oligopeptide/nickel transport system permease subunit